MAIPLNRLPVARSADPITRQRRRPQRPSLTTPLQVACPWIMRQRRRAVIRATATTHRHLPCHTTVSKPLAIGYTSPCDTQTDCICKIQIEYRTINI